MRFYLDKDGSVNLRRKRIETSLSTGFEKALPLWRKTRMKYGCSGRYDQIKSEKSFVLFLWSKHYVLH